MNRTLIVSFCVLALACSKKEEEQTTSTGATVTPIPSPMMPPTTTPTAAPTAAEIEVSPEMKGFLGMLDGSDGAAGKALAKYGSKATVKNDLGMYSLKDPKVTKSEKIGAMQCYTFDSMAGMVKHETRTCWDSSNKIAQITDNTP